MKPRASAALHGLSQASKSRIWTSSFKTAELHSCNGAGVHTCRNALRRGGASGRSSAARPSVTAAVEVGLFALQVSQRATSHFHNKYEIPTTQNVLEPGFYGSSSSIVTSTEEQSSSRREKTPALPRESATKLESGIGGNFYNV